MSKKAVLAGLGPNGKLAVFAAVFVLVFMLGGCGGETPQEPAEAEITEPEETTTTVEEETAVPAPATVTNTPRKHVCAKNLATIRQVIKTREAEGDPYPTNLEVVAHTLEASPQDILYCPGGGGRYEYNPETGEVRCPHPGHEDN